MLGALRGRWVLIRDRWTPLRDRLRNAEVWQRLTAPDPARDRARDLLLVAIVVVPMCFNAVMLWSEVARPVPNVNDDAFHYLMIRSASDAIARGEHPLDPWGPEMDLGAPRFLYYQNLPALFVVGLDRATLGQVGLLDLLNITRYVLMVGLPLTVYWAMRRMGASRVAAAGGAAASSLFSGGGRYGIEYDSFVWRGWGMYTMLWAIHLSFIVMSCLWRLARTGRGAITTILAASALVTSHLLFSEMMVITGVVIFLLAVDRSMLWTRLRQFLLAGAAIGVATSYLWLAYLLNRPYIGESPYDVPWKLESFGASTILGWLATGELFDLGRLPVFTVATALGAASLLLIRSRLRFFAVALFLVWLVLYFGRSIWDPVAAYIPSGSMLLFHRFIASLDFAAILLIGMGFEILWRCCTLIPRRWAALAAGALCLALLVPPVAERQGYYAANARWMDDLSFVYASDAEAHSVISTLRALPPGRVYAGLRANWGERMRIDQVPWYRVLIHEGFSVVSVPLPSINFNSDLMFHFNDQDPAAYDLFDVRYVVAPTGLTLPDLLQPLTRNGKYALYRVPTSGAATYATATVRRNAATKLDLFLANRTWLLGPEPAARSFIRWDYPAPPPALAALPIAGCQDGTLTNEVLQPDQIDVVATCASPSTLVIKTTYHPGWRVTVNGQRRPTYMVSPSYIGVDVPAGRHEVRAKYHSSPLRTGFLLLGGGTLVALVVGRRSVPALRAMLP